MYVPHWNELTEDDKEYCYTCYVCMVIYQYGKNAKYFTYDEWCKYCEIHNWVV